MSSQRKPSRGNHFAGNAATDWSLLLFFSLAEHADLLLHKAFIVGIYGQTNTSSVIAESMKVLRMEAT